MYPLDVRSAFRGLLRTRREAQLCSEYQSTQKRTLPRPHEAHPGATCSAEVKAHEAPEGEGPASCPETARAPRDWLAYSVLSLLAFAGWTFGAEVRCAGSRVFRTFFDMFNW